VVALNGIRRPFDRDLTKKSGFDTKKAGFDKYGSDEKYGSGEKSGSDAAGGGFAPPVSPGVAHQFVAG
jgi:hypothetical protein